VAALLSILLALVTAACTTALFWGVYIDHVRQQRTRRSQSTRYTCEQRHRERSEALDVTGGACADGKPGF
jgi:hypothetical protein